MIKVFVITQNEPFFIPKMIRLLLEKQTKSYQIVGYTVLSPSRKNKSVFSWFKERANIYTLLELIIVGIAFLYSKIAGKIGLSKYHNNRLIFKLWGIKEVITQDINNYDYLKKINSLNPDIIISISSPQLFGEELLSIAKIYCLNVHGTLLPRHRGVFGSFWTLFDKDKEAGGTIHTMELKLDAGEILWQESFDVQPNDTQYSIAYKTKKIMAEGLISLLNKFNNGEEVNVILPIYKSSYHRAPSIQQGKLLKSNKKNIITLSNLKLMVSESY